MIDRKGQTSDVVFYRHYVDKILPKDLNRPRTQRARRPHLREVLHIGRTRYVHVALAPLTAIPRPGQTQKDAGLGWLGRPAR